MVAPRVTAGEEIALKRRRSRPDSKAGGEAPEQSKDSRSESLRSVGDSPPREKSSADLEVREASGRPRRLYTLEYKLRILDELSRCKERGAVGALLRREGLYQSTIWVWRRQFAHGGVEALAPKRPGPAPSQEPGSADLERLKRENERLKKELHQAQLIIEVQKKVARLLGDLGDKTEPGETKSS